MTIAGDIAPDTDEGARRAGLAARFAEVRGRSGALSAPLSAEDQQIQSMDDVSPTKWHLAHTTWFWETFLLGPNLDGYDECDPRFGYLFNSYYEQVGERHPRPHRGLLSRPALDEVWTYRRHVDSGMARLFDAAPQGLFETLAPLVELGLAHEEQHQELLLMDIKHVLSCNPFHPAAYDAPAAGGEAGPQGWTGHQGGLAEIGWAQPGFCFDNEQPRHKTWLEPFELADRPVTNGEFAAFIADGGYRNPTLWLSDGWAWVKEGARTAPAYWHDQDGQWTRFTLHGLTPLGEAAPAVHLSYYEAAAFAEWSGARLPTEQEWEAAACAEPRDSAEGDFLDPGRSADPAPASGEGARGFFGHVWEWTSSAYSPYPGFRPASGAVGEYNGKFMSGQQVLRGGCCATPRGHARATYRNFFYPHQTWQFGGVRLARDA